MDSFYEPPRKPPVPTALEPVFPVPLVPDVSMIAHNSDCSNGAPISCDMWKRYSYQHHINKENCNDSLIFMGTAASFMRKQVRFESPNVKTHFECEPLKSANSFNKCNFQDEVVTANKGIEYSPIMHPSTLAPNLEGKTFQEIYMSNLPNRHLDLSIIDVGNSQNGDTPNLENVKDTHKNFPSLDISNMKKKDNGNGGTKDENDIGTLSKGLPQTYKEFLSLQNNLQKNEDGLQSNDSVTDILNYGRSNKTNCSVPQFGANKCDEFLRKLQKNNSESKTQQNLIVPVTRGSENYVHEHYESFMSKEKLMAIRKCDSDTQTTNIIPEKNDSGRNEQTDQIEKDGEPTVKDLLKIIQQQNEQLLLLQKQVANLIERSDTQKQIEALPADNHMLYSKKCITSTQHEMCTDATAKVNTPRKRSLSKFSIDMMTSFEVSFRPQKNENLRRRIHDLVNQEPGIDEVTETESSNSLSGAVSVDNSEKEQVDSSLHLQVPLQVRENCPSPDPSIKIDMNDYESSEDESTDDVSMDVYANVMDQIEKLLKNANKKACTQKSREYGANGKTGNATMSQVKEATLRHLKSIGVNLPSTEDESNCSMESNVNCKYSPNEVSFAVKQLLMKYLPDEYLARINNDQNSKPLVQMPEEKTDLIVPRPEFSFATVQYMKKYNLLATVDNDDQPHQVGRPIEHIKPPEQREMPPPKILDITALKQQPKLL